MGEWAYMLVHSAPPDSVFLKHPQALCLGMSLFPQPLHGSGAGELKLAPCSPVPVPSNPIRKHLEESAW